MTPKKRLEAGLADLRSKGCQIHETVQKTKQAYERQADRADQCLQAKQRRERNAFFNLFK